MFTQLKYIIPSNQPNDLNRVSPLSQTQYFYVVLFKGMRVAETHKATTLQFKTSANSASRVVGLGHSVFVNVM